MDELKQLEAKLKKLLQKPILGEDARRKHSLEVRMLETKIRWIKEKKGSHHEQS